MHYTLQIDFEFQIMKVSTAKTEDLIKESDKILQKLNFYEFITDGMATKQKY